MKCRAPIPFSRASLSQFVFKDFLEFKLQYIMFANVVWQNPISSDNENYSGRSNLHNQSDRILELELNSGWNGPNSNKPSDPILSVSEMPQRNDDLLLFMQ